MKMLIGYEPEFFVLNKETLAPISGEQYDKFHLSLKEDGWKTVYDPITKKLGYSKKGDILLKTDDPLHTFEANMPPRATIQEAEKDMQELLAFLQTKLEPLGLVMVGMGSYPTLFTKHEATRLNYILVRDGRMGKVGRGWDLFSGNHVWLDIKKEEFAEACHMFTRLSGVLIALFGNAPFVEGKPTKVMENRATYFEGLKDHGFFFGLPEKPYTSFYDALKLIFDLPAYIFNTPEAKVYMTEEEMTNLEYFQKDKVKMVRTDGEKAVLTPILTQLTDMTRNLFTEMRVKWKFKEGTTVCSFMDAFVKKDNQSLLDQVEGVFLEVRTIPTQKFSEMAAGPAFLLGCQMNQEKIISLLDQHDDAFWLKLREDAVRGGLDFDIDGKHITTFAQELVDLAKEGLEKRGHGEEKFLAPLYERIKNKQNPAQETLALLEQKDIKEVVAAFTFS